MRIADCATNGASLLDRLGPRNWAERINLDTLDIGNGQCCALAQVYKNDVMNAPGCNGYVTGKRLLGLGREDLVIVHGFNVALDLTDALYTDTPVGEDREEVQ